MKPPRTASTRTTARPLFPGGPQAAGRSPGRGRLGRLLVGRRPGLIGICRRGRRALRTHAAKTSLARPTSRPGDVADHPDAQGLVVGNGRLGRPGRCSRIRPCPPTRRNPPTHRRRSASRPAPAPFDFDKNESRRATRRGGGPGPRAYTAAMAQKFHIRTFGCQMNEHDSERLAGLLVADGLVPTDGPRVADVVVLNTCCIRENADNKLYGHLGNLKSLRERRPGMQIAVGGCLAQKDRELIRQRAPPRRRGLRDPQPGPGPGAAAPGRASGSGRRDPRRAAARGGPPADQQAAALAAVRDLPYAAWVTIQTGCDNSCAFCIVPSVRGGEVPRPFDDLVAEVAVLARRGVTEVTLLGQNVNSYGRDLTRRRPLFAELLRAVGAVEGIRPGPVHQPPSQGPPARDHRRHGRDRRGLQPAAPARSSRAVTRVLAAMRRGLHRRAVPGPTGRRPCRHPRPGRDHRPHRRLPRRDRGRLRAHPRGGGRGRLRQRLHLHLLPPAGHPGGRDGGPFVAPEVVAERFERLRVVVERSALARHQARIGRVEEVLVEGPCRAGPGVLTGRTGQNKLVHFDPGRPCRSAWVRSPTSGDRGRPPPPHRGARGGHRPPATAPASRWPPAERAYARGRTPVVPPRWRRWPWSGRRRRGSRPWPSTSPRFGPGPGGCRGRARLGRLHGRVPGHGHRHGQTHAGRPGGGAASLGRPGRPGRGVHRALSSSAAARRGPGRHRRPGPRRPAGGGDRALPALGGRRPRASRAAIPRWRAPSSRGGGRAAGGPALRASTPAWPTSTRWPPAASRRPTAGGWSGPWRSPSGRAARSRPSGRDSSAYPPTPGRPGGDPLRPASSTGASPSGSTVLAAGLLDEVRSLAGRPGGLSRTARQALGYRELLAHVEDGVPAGGGVDRGGPPDPCLRPAPDGVVPPRSPYRVVGAGRDPVARWIAGARGARGGREMGDWSAWHRT